VFVHHDVTSENQWQHAVETAAREFGGLDILVNNAGHGDLAAIEETSLEDYERTIAIDQTGVFLGMKVAASLLRSRRMRLWSTSVRSSVPAVASGRHRLTTLPRAPYAR
jgi:NAD(P)-dependent dehydrogenase (short-subunit alcohol dehydrogenase family)